MRPAIDLFCGLGGWTDGLLAEGYQVIGFDIERHAYGTERYPAQLVLQDVTTIHGSQFKDAALIVASPPCQEYSYMAMPWSRAKAIAAEYRSGVRDVKKLTALFDACFRIQREAIEAAGHHIPLIVENVRGAIPWVGRSRWNYGSFHLWGDVPALMPFTRTRFHEIESPHLWLRDPKRAAGKYAPDYTKNNGGSWFNVAHNTTSGKGQNPDGRKYEGGPAFGAGVPYAERATNRPHRHGSRSSARKAASAMIARIPLALARHVAAAWAP